MSPVSSRWSYNGWVCFDIPSFTSFVWYSLFLVQIGNSNEYVRLLVSVCEAFCHHRVCVVVCMKCVWADLPVHLQSLHHQKKGRSCYQMVKQTHHPTAHNSDPVSVRCQGFEGKWGTSSSSSPRLSSLLVLRSFLPITHFRGMKTGWERWSGIHRCVYLIVISEHICPC